MVAAGLLSAVRRQALDMGHPVVVFVRPGIRIVVGTQFPLAPRLFNA
jgi:hypothetical protein